MVSHVVQNLTFATFSPGKYGGGYWTAEFGSLHKNYIPCLAKSITSGRGLIRTGRSPILTLRVNQTKKSKYNIDASQKHF